MKKIVKTLAVLLIANITIGCMVSCQDEQEGLENNEAIVDESSYNSTNSLKDMTIAYAIEHVYQNGDELLVYKNTNNDIVIKNMYQVKKIWCLIIGIPTEINSMIGLMQGSKEVMKFL